MERPNDDARRNSGPECESMSDVRYEIDRLDRVLVQLIAERQTYIEAAARIKADPDTVRDEARIQDVYEKVASAANEAGLSLDIAQPVWRALVENSIAHEHVVWKELREPDSSPLSAISR